MQAARFAIEAVRSAIRLPAEAIRVPLIPVIMRFRAP